MLKLSTGVENKLFNLITLSYRNYTTSLSGFIDVFGHRQTLKVSRTRGTPSTSTDLKEALCEKIPLHHDLLRKFRLSSGASVVSRITVDDLYRGLASVGTMVRETSEIDKKFGVKYRGLTIPEVVSMLPRRGNSPCPEAVFWLLLTGDVPTYEQTLSLTADWKSRREKRRELWSERGGGIIGTVLQSLPRGVSPLGRLAVALTTLRADKHTREALKIGAMRHEHWEYAYEDSMEVLAVLPAIVGLVGKTRDLNNVVDEGDWVDLLLDSLGNTASVDEGKKSSLGEFLRLYITVNADEDGGSPGAHVTQILGDATLDPSQALAAGAPGYANEPNSGSMPRYMEFQKKMQTALGSKPAETALKNYLGVMIERTDGELPGYKESEYFDPRYIVLRNYARENLNDVPDVEFSRIISNVLIPMLRQKKARNFTPEYSAIAAPIFQFYGLRDMEFNQIFLCMSRALGAIASIIWSKAMNAPVERPKSRSTFTYIDGLSSAKKKPKIYPVTCTKRLSK